MNELNNSDVRCKITKEQDNFLRFMETGEATDDFTRQVNEAVCEIRTNKKWRAEYIRQKR